MTPVEWLVDKSALWRLPNADVADSLLDRMAAGVVGVSITTELEMGYSARSLADYARMRERYVDDLPIITMPVRAEARARDVQRMLVERGQHRGVSVPDLLIAATSETEGLTALHYDADFDLIADVTGQRMEWIVARGSI